MLQAEQKLVRDGATVPMQVIHHVVVMVREGGMQI
jgi:hypothetical protein